MTDYTVDPDAELDSDECEALGLDNTGRDGDPRFPYTYGNLTDDELVLLELHWDLAGR